MCFGVSVGVTMDAHRSYSHIEGHHTLVPPWCTFRHLRWYLCQRETIWFHAALDVHTVHSLMYALIDGDELITFFPLPRRRCVCWMDYRELLCECCFFDQDLMVLFFLVALFVRYDRSPFWLIIQLARTYSMLARLVRRIPCPTSLRVFNEILTHFGRLP